MFGWLRRWFNFSPVFRPIAERRRQIFRYWDGEKWRSADPIQALTDLHGHPEYRYDIHPQLVDEGDPEATRITCDAVCAAFGIKRWTESSSGLTVLEILQLLATFANYLESLKKSTGPSPTPPSPTDATSPLSSEPITSGSSPSGCSDIEPNSATPTASA